MPGLRLDIKTSDAKRNLNKALAEMRAAASVPIEARLKINTNSIKRAKKEIQSLRREMAEITNLNGSIGSKGLKSSNGKRNEPLNKNSKQTTKSVQRYISDVGKAINQLNNKDKQLRNQITSFEKSLNKQKLNSVPEFVNQLNQLKKSLRDIDDFRSNLTDKEKNGSSIKKSDHQEFNKILKKADRIRSEVGISQSKVKSMINYDALDAELSTLEKKISDAQLKFNKFTQENGNKMTDSQTESLRRQMRVLSEYQTKVKDAQNALGDPSSIGRDKVDYFNKMSQDADKAANRVVDDMKNIENSLNSVETQEKNMRAFDKLGNRLTAYFKQYGAQIVKNQELFDKYNTLMYKLNHGQFASAAEANNAFASFRMEARQAGVEIDTLGAKLERTFGARLRSALAGQGVAMINIALRDIVQNAVDVDTAMTELKKVTDLTDTGYVKFLDGAGDRAAKLGATLTEVVNATADYARLGFSVPEAKGLADSALVYENVGDGLESIDEATSHLISTMQGFGIESDKSMQIVDRFNEVANRFPASASDIGAMVMRSASAMAAANNDLDETIALGVTANTVKNCLAA